MNREYEFAKMYYDWVEKCLLEDNKIEALAFFKLGCDICVRQRELLNIKWNQIDYPYIGNIQKSIKRDPLPYPPLRMNLSTEDALNRLWTKDTDINTKIFKHDQQWYMNEIRESSGDKIFHGHLMRHIGLIFKIEETK